MATSPVQNIKGSEEQYLNTAEVKTDEQDLSVYYVNSEKFHVCGTKLAIHLYIENADSKTKGGILLPGNLRNKEAIDSPVGRVIAMGKDAYKESMFASPYCVVNDWVVFPRSAISRMNWDHTAQIVFTDDVNIISVVPRPDGIKRAIPIDRF